MRVIPKQSSKDALVCVGGIITGLMGLVIDGTLF